MNNFYDSQNNICNLCPRDCGRRPGFCGEGFPVRISRAALHFYEEPIISGNTGSGAVFFTGCNLKCIFCQNNSIANNTIGEEVSISRLEEIYWELCSQGANNINLVTPSHFIPEIADSIKIAKSNGFKLPIVYNSSGYESVKALRLLDGLIDVYLPDYKYEEKELAQGLSRAGNYSEIARLAIDEMYNQVGAPILNYSEKNRCDLINRGLIIRHLVLPGHIKNSIKCIDYLADKYKDNIYISIMNQYTPMNNPGLSKYPELQRSVTKREYEKVIHHILDLELEKVFIQEGNTCKESFIPEFDLTGIKKATD